MRLSPVFSRVRSRDRSVRFPGENASGRGLAKGLRVGLVVEEALDAVVDQLVAPVLQHLAHHEPRRVADPFGLRTRGLQPTELFDDLVKKHHDIAAGEEAIEGVGVFDEGRCVRDIYRAG